jgi:transcriptional regulator with XRE-family HTH domain
MTLSSIVSWNLLTLRRQRRLTQGALAKKAGLSISYISMMERGGRAPTLGTLEALAKALRVPAPSLLKGPRSRRG